MEIIKYTTQKHKEIIEGAVKALKAGKVIAYPTDTSYGLAADVTNEKALKKIYKIKERSKSQPIHVIIPSVEYAKKIVKWDEQAETLAKEFWPGPLTLVLKLKAKDEYLEALSAGTGFLGVRIPKNKIAVDLCAKLGKPITTTSANPSLHLSGGADSYSGQEVYDQFEGKDYKPDFIIDAGKLPKRKPSTIVRIREVVEILRPGHIHHKKIKVHFPEAEIVEQYNPKKDTK